MALTPTDWLVAGYVLFVSVLVAVRWPLPVDAQWGILAMHGLVAALLVLVTRPGARGVIGRIVHTFYPVLLLVPLYTAIGLINRDLRLDAILANDAVVQRWEETVFGGQVSFTLIREHPSVFWSGLLHLAYLAYYPIILGGPLLVALRHGLAVARPVVFGTMIAYMVCYAVFLLFPVAGPYYAFPHPTGPVREVWSADLVYALLADGSSVGAAYPSSHVAATVATVWGAWRAWRGLGLALLVPTALLTVATVYCQMHYAVDAATGLLMGLVAGVAAQWLWLWWSSAAEAGAVTVESPISSASLPRTSRR